MQRHHYIKLAIDRAQIHDTKLSKENVDSKAVPPEYDRSAEVMITHYLSELRNHAELTLRQQLPATAFLSTPIVFIVRSTVRGFHGSIIDDYSSRYLHHSARVRNQNYVHVQASQALEISIWSRNPKLQQYTSSE